MTFPLPCLTFRAGRHMGKIVITRRPGEDVQVPIRPAVQPLKLDPDVSYLIIGGLKGACGTLAIHMAQHGARHIVVGNRSGISDEASANIVEGCATFGCTVVEARGDVGDSDWVQNLVKTTKPRLAGVIQGAMVIRVSCLQTGTYLRNVWTSLTLHYRTHHMS
jgi:hypothetical protein